MIKVRRKIKIQEDIANVSSGLGVRGFGDVSGTPKIGDDDEENNTHIERVIQGSLENNQNVSRLIQSQPNGTSVLDEPDDNWWAKAGSKGSSLTSLGKPSKSTTKTLKEQIANVTGAAVPGTGDDAQAFPRADNKYKKQNEKDSSAILRRLQTGIFAGNTTFKVPTHIFEKAKYEKIKGKHWRKYMEDDDLHPEIREFARKNPKSPIIFEDEKTGYMFYAKYGKKRK